MSPKFLIDAVRIDTTMHMQAAESMYHIDVHDAAMKNLLKKTL